MRKNITRIVFIVSVLLACIDAAGQSSIGLSFNYGDKLNFTPNYPGLLLKRNSFSPTLVYSMQRKFHSDFSVIFGGQVGIAGYQLVPVSRDTLGPSGDRSPFADYGIFVGRLELTPGKIFQIGKRECLSDLEGELAITMFSPIQPWMLLLSIKAQGLMCFLLM